MSNRLTGDFRKYMNKNYLGSWDVPKGSDLILTIDHVEQNDIKNERGTERKLTLHFRERDYKPMILNTTNSKRIAKAYNSNDVETWENKKIAIYTENVTAFGGTTDALRIRDYPPKADEYFCECCGELIKDQVIDGKRRSAKAIANNAITRFNETLCWDCYCKRKAQEANDAE